MFHLQRLAPLVLAAGIGCIHAADLATPLANVKFPENMTKANGKVYVSHNDGVSVLSAAGSQWQAARHAVGRRRCLLLPVRKRMALVAAWVSIRINGDWTEPSSPPARLRAATSLSQQIRCRRRCPTV